MKFFEMNFLIFRLFLEAIGEKRIDWDLMNRLTNDQSLFDCFYFLPVRERYVSANKLYHLYENPVSSDSRMRYLPRNECYSVDNNYQFGYM